MARIPGSGKTGMTQAQRHAHHLAMLEALEARKGKSAGRSVGGGLDSAGGPHHPALHIPKRQSTHDLQPLSSAEQKEHDALEDKFYSHKASIGERSKYMALHKRFEKYDNSESEDHK